MDYTEKDLAKLIETVETEFTAHLSKAEALAKSEGEPPKKEEKPKEEKPAAEAKPEAKPSEGAAPAPAAAPEAKPAEGAPAAAAPAAAPAGHGYDDEDMQHMDKMYASMSREELMAHHDSVKRALDAQGAQGAAPAPAAAAPAAPGTEFGKSEKGKSELKDENPVLNSKPKAGGTNLDSDPKNGGIEGQQPSGSPGAKSPASDASKSVQMDKAEHARRNGGKIEDSPPHNSPGAKSPASKAEGVQMEKSEKDFNLIKGELEAEKAKSAELKKNFDTAQEFLTKLVSKIAAPKGKAITEVAALAKNEAGNETTTLSKAEITEKLFRKSSDPKLEKSDREAINKFYDGGQVNINAISHLLK